MTSEAQLPNQAAVKSGVTPYLMVGDAAGASAFYQSAFAAEEVARAGEPGAIMHIHLYINGGSVMLSDAFPEHGYPLVKPQACTLHIQTDDPQAWWDRAVAAGCTVVTPLALQFWGDRYGQLWDPYDVMWSIGGPA